MNKKQEALRRGLRSFIEDTSRELADLEGRALGPSPDSAESVDARETGTPRASATAVIASPTPAAPEPPTAEPVVPRIVPVPVPPPTTLETRLLQVAAPSSVVPLVDPLHPAVPQDKPPESVATEVTAPRVAPQPTVRMIEPAPIAPPPAKREAGDGRGSQPLQAPTRSPRRAQGAARRRPRTRITADLGADGVSAEQAHARKGVCFAYFLNHECWRVPQAYCNGALQVCIIRECPVYHLHKEALERRFARKFNHFW